MEVIVFFTTSAELCTEALGLISNKNTFRTPSRKLSRQPSRKKQNCGETLKITFLCHPVLFYSSCIIIDNPLCCCFHIRSVRCACQTQSPLITKYNQSMKPVEWENPSRWQEVNVAFDTPICPSHHGVVANRRGRPAHFGFIHPYQFLNCPCVCERERVSWKSGVGTTGYVSLHRPKINRGPLIMVKPERQRSWVEDSTARGWIL